VVLLGRPRVDDDDPVLAEPGVNVTPGGDDVVAAAALPLGGRRRHELVADGAPLARPGVEAAVEQPRRGMPEQLEEPERARRPDARAFVVDDDLPAVVDAAGREQVLDDPEEGAHRRRVGVDEAEAVEIEVDGAGQGAAGELLGRPEVDHERTGRADPLVQGSRGDEQFRVRVAVGRHGAASLRPGGAPAIPGPPYCQIFCHQ
jgi:hypothetical protein